MVVLTSTHSLCFEQKYEKYQNFLSENFQFLVVKFLVYLNRHVFVMKDKKTKTKNKQKKNNKKNTEVIRSSSIGQGHKILQY